MKRTLPILFIAFSLTAFAGNGDSEKGTKRVKSGTYGVCACETTSGIDDIKLSLREDGSFRYLHTSAQGKMASATGNWHQEGKRIEFTNVVSSAEFPTSWKMDDRFPCLSGRSNLTFTRICHKQSCD